MEKYTSSPYKLSLITTGISLAGMVCLVLADLLPWPAFTAILLLHLLVLKVFYTRISIAAPLVVVVCLLVVCLEFFRVHLQGREMLILALRDIIIFFAVIRLVLPKTTREIYQIIGIALAECILATIFTLSPLFLIGLTLMLCMVPMALYYLDGIGYGQDKDSPDHGSLHWPGVWCGIIIISIILFYIIPRPSSTIIKSSLFSQPRTGFSEEVDLSRTGSIEVDSSVVMRIVWETGKAPETFYLTGARLEKMSSNGFSRESSQPKKLTLDSSSTDKITIYPTGLAARNVFYPYRLAAIVPGNVVRQGKNYYWSGDVPPVYEVRVHRNQSDDPACSTYVPAGLMRVGALGSSLAGRGAAAQQVARIEDHLRNHYTYSLNSEEIPGDFSPIEWFVFQGKSGSCEYFASALAAMIRGCGIPSRVVTGYLVHEFNTNGEYFIVKSSDAHAWVEYWDGSWHIADATPRSDSLSGSRSNVFDTLRFKWIRWIIQYSLEDQVRLAGVVLLKSPDIDAEMGYALYAGMGIVISAGIIWLIYFTLRMKSLPAYLKILRAFRKKGVVLNEQDSHEQHLSQITKHWSAMAPDFRAYLRVYLAWRFGGRKTDITAHTHEMIDKIRSTPRPKISQ